MYSSQTMKCHRCYVDSLYELETTNSFCWTCDCKKRKIKICVVCFKSLKNGSELCKDCVYSPTKIITDVKKVFPNYFKFKKIPRDLVLIRIPPELL